ncbi:MAG TPA: 30S ribosomal protein S3 [Candidatus Hydrogenedentes bacterium]|nr:30S ribosomal protein S3 [Candidatus Hydrogenedentota bacterium]HOK88828.1 30S ribosomal protein S3 [Candidatus Hydrogenedentota bacterium]
MGQKVHPFGFRLGVIYNWSSRWYGDRDYVELLHKDLEIRRYVKKRLDGDMPDNRVDVAKIDIERVGRKTKVIVHAARSGAVIGNKGERAGELERELTILTGQNVVIEVVEVTEPDLCAQLVAERLALDLEKRVSFRRAMKRAVQNCMRAGAKGVRIKVSGRLNGAEIARSEQTREGSVPLHTLRAMVDYGFATAYTTYGTIGVKCWIYLGETQPGDLISGVAASRLAPSRRGPGGREAGGPTRPGGRRRGRGDRSQ